MATLSYELAKRIKTVFEAKGMNKYPREAPQPYNQYSWTVTYCEHDDYQGTDKRIPVPMLQELIQGCGEDFGGISRSKKGEWIAYSIKALTLEDAISGTTPEEAVAKLWLALYE